MYHDILLLLRIRLLRTKPSWRKSQITTLDTQVLDVYYEKFAKKSQNYYMVVINGVWYDKQALNVVNRNSFNFFHKTHIAPGIILWNVHYACLRVAFPEHKQNNFFFHEINEQKPRNNGLYCVHVRTHVIAAISYKHTTFM